MVDTMCLGFRLHTHTYITPYMFTILKLLTLAAAVCNGSLAMCSLHLQLHASNTLLFVAISRDEADGHGESTNSA